MALEAVVYQQDFWSYNGSKDLYSLLGGNWGYVDHSCGLEKEDGKGCSFDHFLENQTESFLHGDYWNNSTSSSSPPSMVTNFNELYHPNNSSPDNNYNAMSNNNNKNNGNGNSSNGLLDPPDQAQAPQMEASTSCIPITRPKRRRAKSRKNKEEIENQRMTHIAVERNRRKQMNEYLSVLRSLMPDSYVQRGDQASIIGGAINFVKELEHRLQLLGAQKEMKEKSESGLECSPFTEFFTFPQYSTSSSGSRSDQSNNSVANMMSTETTILTHETQSSIADIEVNMVESHANLKIRSKRRPKQLLKLVSGLHSLRLTVLHLNVTTADEFVLYSLSVKIEDDCNLTSGDDIATTVYQLLGRIQEGA